MVNFSIVWKALVEAFPLTGEWIVWNLGNGKSVHIGEDPWEGATFACKFCRSGGDLHNLGIFSLCEGKKVGWDEVGRSV
jgi:hypothetical protein